MTVRMRYTILYGVLFIVSGTGLLGLTAAFSIRQTVQATGQMPPPDQRSRQLFWGAATALAVMMLVSLLIGRAVANLVLRPLRRITAATRRISADNLHERLAVGGPADEVKALADTVDDLLDRLELAFDAQRRFVANASHELRTPLATMRAALDVAMAKSDPVPVVLADRLHAELDRVDGLLEGFLTLTRAQHGALADRTEVALGDLVTAALRTASGNGLQTYASTDAGATVIGNEVLLARMVSNVIENGSVHNVPGGWLRAEVTGSVLVVENSGPVLDPAQVARLGRPFERLGTDRTGSGSGLGLSIVHAIAAAHGGSVAVTARESGGLRVEITLPAAPPGSAARSSPARRLTAAARPGSSSAPEASGPGRAAAMRVLVVEDAAPLAEVLAEGLRDQGMAVDVASDGLIAAAKLDVNAYDVVLLDRDLPGLHGDTLCQMITAREPRPMVLMLTAAGSADDRVRGLTLGADDYLPKPFHFQELILRCRSLARRRPNAHGRILRGAGIELDPQMRTVTRNGVPLSLSVKEFEVLQALLRAAPGFVSSEDLLEQVWDENADPFTNTVTVTVGRLRRKLGDPPVILTIPGIGYRLTE